MQIAITGCGWVTPLTAGDISTVLAAYARRARTEQNHLRYQPIGPEIFSPFSNLPAEAAKEEAVRLAAVALELAWNQAGLSKESYSSDRKGLVLGSALAGVSGMIDFANDVREQSARFVSPIQFPQTVGNYMCGALARCYDFRGPASTIACGCASSLEAIREGCALLASGQADVVVAGGSELLNDKLAEGLSQPGIHFADGACLFVLETETAVAARKGKLLAKIEISEAVYEGALESIAGLFRPSALTIERWVGRTLGADGAAALAAGIGTTMGNPVPWFSDGKDISSLSAGRNNFLAQKLLVRAADTSGQIHEIRAVVELS